MEKNTVRMITLEDGLHDILVEENAGRLADSMKGPRLTRARDILNKFRLQGDAIRETDFDELAAVLSEYVDRTSEGGPGRGKKWLLEGVAL